MKSSAPSPLPVLIVGAGPTGLILALWLAKLSVPFRLVDCATGPGLHSRAIILQSRPLEHFRTLGVADDLVAAGRDVVAVVWRHWGRECASLRLAHFGHGISKFPYSVSLPQDQQERIMLRHVEAAGGKVEWETTLTGLEQDGDRARATLRRADGTEEVCEASYVAGCDGAHSAVRELVGIQLRGGTYAQRYFVADAQATGPATQSPWVNACFANPDFCMCLPLNKEGHVRLIGMILDPDAHITFESVKPAVERTTGLTITGVDWFTVYKIHHRVADNFQAGRVFLLGDACHLHSPVGGQGMNAGLGDATNLAWKLAAVLKGPAPEAMLRTYEPERMAFARVLVKTTDRMFGLTASRTFLSSFMRAFFIPYILPLILRLPSFGRAAFKRVGQMLIDYRSSALSEGRVGDVYAGDRMPWVLFADGSDNFESTGDLKWQLHVYGEVPEALKRIDGHLWTTRIFPFTKEVRAAGLTESAIYLVRPDGHIGLATEDARDITAYLNHEKRAAKLKAKG